MCISYNKSGKGNNQVSIYGTDISSDSLISISYGKGMEFNTGKHTEIVVLFYCSGGTEKVTIYNDVMLNLGSTALPYEPYTGGAPSPSPDYPQPITNAGKYNEGTGKWEYEITIANEQTDPDKNQTVTLTSDRPLTKWDRLEKRNGQWEWVYKSNVVEYDGSADEAWTYISDGTASRAYTIISDVEGEGLCDKFPEGNALNEGYFDISLNYLRFNVYNIADSAGSWKTWLQSNPITVWHETAEETFVPLSKSEQ